MKRSSQNGGRRSSQLNLLIFYETIYRPAKHPGDPRSRTCQEYRNCLRALGKPAAFAQWRNKPEYVHKAASEIYAKFNEWYRWHNCVKFEARVCDLSDDLVDQTRSFLVDAGASRTTANKIRRHVNAVWRFAYKRGLIHTLPDNDKYAVDVDEPVALLGDELKAILDTAARQRGRIERSPSLRCSSSGRWTSANPSSEEAHSVLASDWWPACILFVYSLGIRISAAASVPTANIDWDRGEVVIPARSQKQRREQRLDLFPSAVEALRKLRLIERGVTTVLGDWPFTVNTLRRYYKKILIQAGLFKGEKVPGKYLFHCLRKTLASQLYEKAGIQVACARLGHSNVSVTQVYIDPRYKEAPLVRKLLADPLTPFEPSAVAG